MHGIAAIDHGSVQKAGHLSQLFSRTEFAVLLRSWSTSEEFQTPHAQRTVKAIVWVHRYRQALWVLSTLDTYYSRREKIGNEEIKQPTE